MRIAWVTPSTNKTSVSEFSVSVLKQILKIGVTADVYTFDDDYAPIFNELKTLKIKIGSNEDFDRNIYDFIIYNFGNNWENHGKIFKFASEYPGIVIMHDAALHHVIAHYSREIEKNNALYANLMVNYYGFEGARILNASMIESQKPKFSPWDSAFGPDYSFVDFFTRNQIGCIFNSNYARGKLKASNVPVLTLRLPGDEKGEADLNEISVWKKRFKDKSSVTLCSLGYINSAKNIELIIDSLNEIRNKGVDANLTILGGISDSKYLKELTDRVETLGLQKNIEFHLNLHRAEFNTIKNKADIFISLRYPNYEGCSAAAFEAMQTSRPLFCLSSGPFAEIPKDSVIHIDDLNPDTISTKIINSLRNKSALIRTGQRGLIYSSSYSSNHYANDIKNFLSSESFANLKNRSRNISGFRAIEVDKNFFNPSSIFLERSPDKAVSALLSIKDFKNLFSTETSSRYLQLIYEENPMLFWDIFGFVKSLFTGRYKSVRLDLSTREPTDLDIFLRILSLCSNKILLIAFLMPLISRKIEASEFEKKSDIDCYLISINLLAGSKNSLYCDFFRKIQIEFSKNQ